jgi:minor extracellular serine protease Vpr
VKRFRAGLLAALVATALVVVGVVSAAGSSTGPTPVGTELIPTDAVPLSIQRGDVTVAVNLTDPSLASKKAATPGGLSKGEQQAYVNQLKTKQKAVSDRVQSLGGRQLAQLTKALNAIVVEVDRGQIRAIEALPDVKSVRIVRNYELDLSETVPYIGAAALQAIGKDGTGARVAVLDSGVDYTHVDLGGSGTAAAYTNAYGTTTADARNTTLDGLFPTSKVIAGFDFVGESWPNGARTEDPDPIDCGPQTIPAPCAGGHGTHVSDIIAGVGPAKGVAPGAKILLYKVCSAVSTSCNGVALLKAVDAAMDPNGDGAIDDHADVINLSLGQSYGQDEDDLTKALNNAVDGGAIVVASAGNSADRPYIVGSPSTGENVISVAQTQVPSAKLYRVAAANATVAAVWQDWSHTPVLTTGTLVYDTTSPNTRRGCSTAAGANPYAAGSHTGQILLMDRGLCAVSFKVSNARAAGAIAAIVANNASQAPGDLPPSFSFGGGTPDIPGYTITLADGNCLKGVGCTSSLNASATIDPATAANLVGNMVSSSSRGPTFSRNSIKPDIGAPGASVSAEAGTGSHTTAFGGTSGAAPMISGSAAILQQAFPNRAPFEIKSLLMNTADTNIGINPIGLPGFLAPITRIGGGEVRVKAAYDSTTAAWDEKDKAGSLSFGYQATSVSKTLTRTVVVRNYSGSSITYAVAPTFRYGNDQSSGAVTFNVPSSITVGANSQKSFDVGMTIDPSKLPIWALNGGAFGGDGFRLNTPEYDGYLMLDGGAANKRVHLAWQVLPHRAADVGVQGQKSVSGGAGTIQLKNKSNVLDGGVEVFSLTGTSPQIQKKALPKPGDNFAIVDLKSVGIRSVDLGGGTAGVQFGIDTYGARAHPNYPAEFDIHIDTNRDGTTDFIAFNLENGGFGATGQNVVAVLNVATGATAIRFFNDADLNSGNAIFTVLRSDIGLTATQQFNFSVFAFDNYFTGNLTDSIENMTYTLGTPKFAAAGPATFSVPAGGSSSVSVSSVAGGAAASPSQLGILFLYRDAEGAGGNDPSKNEAEGVPVTP